MKKIFNKAFLWGFVVGLFPLILIYVFLYHSPQKPFADETSSQSDTSSVPTYEDYMDWMKGVQGDLTNEEYHDLQVRCYFENLYYYARDWNLVDSAMTFEEFLRLPVCNEDSIDLFREESK